jgi:hypothetical protein
VLSAELSPAKVAIVIAQSADTPRNRTGERP